MRQGKTNNPLDLKRKAATSDQLEQPLSRTCFNGSKGVRATKMQLYEGMSSFESVVRVHSILDVDAAFNLI